MMLYPGPQPGSGGGTSGPKPSYIRLTCNAQPVRGTTNTNILRYPVVDKNLGDFEPVDSVTLGTHVPIPTEGIYRVFASSSGVECGVKKNTALNNNYATTNTDLPLNLSTMSSGGSQSGEVYCNAGDLLWVVAAGTLQNHPTRCVFSVYGPLPVAD